MATVTRPITRGMATFGKNSRKFFVGGNTKAVPASGDIQVSYLSPCTCFEIGKVWRERNLQNFYE